MKKTRKLAPSYVILIAVIAELVMGSVCYGYTIPGFQCNGHPVQGNGWEDEPLGTECGQNSYWSKMYLHHENNRAFMLADDGFHLPPRYDTIVCAPYTGGTWKFTKWDHDTGYAEQAECGIWNTKGVNHS